VSIPAPHTLTYAMIVSRRRRIFSASGAPASAEAMRDCLGLVLPADHHTSVVQRPIRASRSNSSGPVSRAAVAPDTRDRYVGFGQAAAGKRAGGNTDTAPVADLTDQILAKTNRRRPQTRETRLLGLPTAYQFARGRLVQLTYLSVSDCCQQVHEQLNPSQQRPGYCKRRPTAGGFRPSGRASRLPLHRRPVAPRNSEYSLPRPWHLHESIPCQFVLRNMKLV
jgi:hypothetical protein